MKNTGRNIKRFIILLFVLIVLLIISAAAYIYFNGDNVKQNLITELNKELDIEISVETIEFNLFQNFPDVSLNFSDVVTKHPNSPGRKQLLKAGEVSVMFNLPDLFRGNYIIKRIHIKNAFLNLYVTGDGEKNFIVLKSKKDGESKTLVDLKKAKFNNVSVSFIHIPSNQEYLFRIDAGSLGGVFSAQNQSFNFSGDVFSNYIRSGNNTFLSNVDLSVNTKIEINDEENSIHFHKGDIDLSDVSLDVNGSVNLNETEKFLDLNVFIPSTSVRSILRYIPEQYLTPVNLYELSGFVEMNTSISGEFGGNKIPQVDSEFKLEKGKLIHKTYNTEFSGLALNGTFTNGRYRNERSFSLIIRDFEARFLDGDVNGWLRIKDFQKPEINTKIAATVDLYELEPFIKSDTIESLDGRLSIDVEFSKKLQSFRRFTMEDFINSKTAGDLVIENVSVKLKNDIREYDQLNGSFKFDNDDLIIEKFSGKISRTDFQMNGYFENIMAFLFIPGEPIRINADLLSNEFYLDDILKSAPKAQKNEAQLFISGRVNMNLNFQIKHFYFRKFNSTNNSGILVQKNKILLVKQANLNSMDGKVSINGSLNGKDDDLFFLNCNASFTDVNINKLFHDFGNFGQENLTDRNLEGRLTAKVTYSSTLTPGLYVNPKSVSTLANIEISDGELIGYEPLYKLSRFVKKGEFEHIRFSTLQNEISIINEVIYIPEMDINSSSMNLRLFGNHGFDNTVDYHVELDLADIIARKEQIKKDLEGDFISQKETGRTKLFLSMTGNAKDPVLKYDSRMVKRKISDNLKREKENIANILKEEFGGQEKENENSDSLEKLNKSGADFLIEWEEVSKDQKPQQTEKPGKTKNKTKKEDPDFIIIWDEQKDTINEFRNRR